MFMVSCTWPHRQLLSRQRCFRYYKIPGSLAAATSAACSCCQLQQAALRLPPGHRHLTLHITSSTSFSIIYLHPPLSCLILHADVHT